MMYADMKRMDTYMKGMRIKDTHMKGMHMNRKGMSITFSTIIIIIILLVTLLAVLFFFRGGFASAGGAIGKISGSAEKGADDPRLSNPSTWFCSSEKWLVYFEGEESTAQFSTDGYPTHDKCRAEIDSSPDRVGDSRYTCKCER